MLQYKSPLIIEKSERIYVLTELFEVGCASVSLLVVVLKVCTSMGT